MVDAPLQEEVAIPIDATFVGGSSVADHAATRSAKEPVRDAAAYNETNVRDSEGNTHAQVFDDVVPSAEQDIESFCIDVDVPLTEPDMLHQQNEACTLGSTITDASTVASTPNKVGRQKSSRKSAEEKKTAREKSKKGDALKVVDKKKTGSVGDLGDGTVRSMVSSIVLEHDSDRKDISRPASRASKGSSFNGICDEDFMTKYKRLKLILKEKEIEIKKLEEEAEHKEELLKKQVEANQRCDTRWNRLRIWKTMTASSEEKELSVPDPAVIARKLRRRRVLALVFIGIVLTVIPIVAVTQLRPIIVS